MSLTGQKMQAGRIVACSPLPLFPPKKNSQSFGMYFYLSSMQQDMLHCPGRCWCLCLLAACSMQHVTDGHIYYQNICHGCIVKYILQESSRKSVPVLCGQTFYTDFIPTSAWAGLICSKAENVRKSECTSKEGTDNFWISAFPSLIYFATLPAPVAVEGKSPL